MPTPKQFTEVTPARFPPGTFDAIAAVLRPGEDRASFIRVAVLTALESRNAAAEPQAPDRLSQIAGILYGMHDRLSEIEKRLSPPEE